MITNELRINCKSTYFRFASLVLVSLFFLGDSAVGKTSLLVRMCDNKFTLDYISTIGNFLDNKKKNILYRC